MNQTLNIIWPIRIFDLAVRATHHARIENLKKISKVKIIFCNNYLTSCEGNPNGNKMKCFACSYYVKALSRSTNTELIRLSNYKYTSLDDISDQEVKYLEEKTYNAAIGTIASFEAVSSEERLSNKGKKAVSLLFKNSISYYHLLKEIIINKKNDGFININLNTFNGRYATTIQHYLIHKNYPDITCYYYEIWGKKNPYLSKNKITHDANYIFQSCKKRSETLTLKEFEDTAKDYFFQRWYLGGSKYGETNYIMSQQKNLLIKKIRNKKVISIFPSSNFEYNFMPYGYKPVLQDREISNFIKYLKIDDYRYEIIIRLHPHLQRSNIAEYKSFINLEELSDLKITVKCILPNTKESSLELMKQSDYVVTFASFSAVEANYLRKKVIQIGDSRYRYFNIANNFNSGQDAARALVNKKVYIKPTKGAKYFACGFVIRDEKFLNFENVSGKYFINKVELKDHFYFERIKNIFLSFKEKLYYFLTRSGAYYK